MSEIMVAIVGIALCAFGALTSWIENLDKDGDESELFDIYNNDKENK